MLNEFNSWLLTLLVFGGSSYLLGFAKQTQSRKTFFSVAVTFTALAVPILYFGYHVNGVDTIRYMYDYVTIRTDSFREIISDFSLTEEYGYIILTKTLSYFKSTRLFMTVCGSIIVLSFYLATKNINPESLAMSMLIFFFGLFSVFFNALRQGLAVAIVAYSYKYVLKKDFLKFLFFVFLAMTFHLSSIIAVVVYFLWTKDEKTLPWPLLALILIGAIAVSLGLDSILTSLSSREFENHLLAQYSSYTAENALEAKNRDFYVDLLVSFILAIHYKRLVKVNKRNSLFIFMFFLSTSLGLCGFVNPYTKRIAYYFSIGICWALADIPKCYHDHHSVWTARLLIIAYAITRFTIIASLGQSAIIPYIWLLPPWAR